jgi:hypothetical protein
MAAHCVAAAGAQEVAVDRIGEPARPVQTSPILTKREAADFCRVSLRTFERFRHSRLTYLGTKTDNLSGVMYLAGHRQPATTARYPRPQQSAAEEVLKAVAAAATPRSDALEFWLQSGCKPEKASGREGEATSVICSEFTSVRGGGIEPPWLLTASTSS